jgi:tetratricopeptide (TPR) repeat protein
MSNLEKAIQLRKSGDLEESRTLLIELVKQEPHNPVIWYQCAWAHDMMGLEREAVPFYTKSLELGLIGEDRQGALLGLGSTYRTLGMYEEAKGVFQEAIKEYPERREFQVFYAMVQYNLQEYSKAMEILLKQLVETSNDPEIQTYKRAILFYSDKLDQIFDGVSE